MIDGVKSECGRNTTTQTQVLVENVDQEIHRQMNQDDPIILDRPSQSQRPHKARVIGGLFHVGMTPANSMPTCGRTEKQQRHTLPSLSYNITRQTEGIRFGVR